MEIIIEAMIDGKLERRIVVPFPNAVHGFQTYGILEQLARNRQSTSLYESLMAIGSGCELDRQFEEMFNEKETKTGLG